MWKLVRAGSSMAVGERSGEGERRGREEHEDDVVQAQGSVCVAAWGPERTDWAATCPTWPWTASVTSTQCWFSQDPSPSAQRDLKQEPGSTGMLAPICAPEMPVLPLLFGLG